MTILHAFESKFDNKYSFILDKKEEPPGSLVDWREDYHTVLSGEIMMTMWRP